VPVSAYLYVVVALVVLIAPVKVAAVFIDARRSGFIVSAVTAIVGALVWAFLAKLVPYGMIVALFGSAVVYMLALGTTYWRGLLIAFSQVAAWGLYMYLFLRAVVSTLFETLRLPQ
jgi:hypothetical protein